MRQITLEQRQQLVVKHAHVVGLLLAVGDPCPGCWRPVDRWDLEFHHIPWRRSDSYSFEQDLMLLDVCNGVLTHHACHMKEGWDFQVRASLLLWHRVGVSTLLRFRSRLEKQGVLERDFPPALQAVIDTMAHRSSKQYCPSCRAYHVHEARNPAGKVGAGIESTGRLTVKALCWSCLRVFPAGSSLNGG